MKPLHYLLAWVPLLASCEPIVREFEPHVSGAPARTTEARTQLQASVVKVATRHGLIETRPLRRATTSTNETLLSYFEAAHGQTGWLDFELCHDHVSDTYKIRLTDMLRFRRSKLSKKIEREVRTSLP